MSKLVINEVVYCDVRRQVIHGVWLKELSILVCDSKQRLTCFRYGSWLRTYASVFSLNNSRRVTGAGKELSWCDPVANWRENQLLYVRGQSRASFKETRFGVVLILLGKSSILGQSGRCVCVCVWQSTELAPLRAESVKFNGCRMF